MVNFVDCSDWVQSSVVFGMLCMYLLVGLIVAAFLSKIFGEFEGDWEDLFMIVIIWPFLLVVLIIGAIGRWFLTPFWAATKTDLRDTERRLSNEINEQCSEPIDVSILKGEDFKIGDIITGIVPQTDDDGDKMSYHTLYQGCKCRVQDIDSDGDMDLLLIDHKDKDANRGRIGKIFEGMPARNFTLVKDKSKKQKVVKKSKR